MTVLHVPQSFPTIADAVAAAEPGDTVLVKPGVYREKVTITTSFIRLVAQGDKVVLDGQGRRAQAFLIQDAEGVEINGFIIRNYRLAGILVRRSQFNRLVRNRIRRISAGEGVHIEGDGNLVWQNTIANASGDGILVLHSDGNWIVENRSHGNGGFGILIDGGKNSAIVGNQTLKNKNFGIASTGDNTLIIDNSLIANGPATVTAASSEGATGSEQTGNNVVIHTKILRNRLPGIVLSRRNTFVARNLVKGNQGTGIRVGETARFNSVEENRIIDNQANGLQVDGQFNLILRNQMRGNTPFDLVLNNPENDLIDNQCGTSDPPGLCE